VFLEDSHLRRKSQRPPGAGRLHKDFARFWACRILGMKREHDGWTAVLLDLLKEAHGQGFKHDDQTERVTLRGHRMGKQMHGIWNIMGTLSVVLFSNISMELVEV